MPINLTMLETAISSALPRIRQFRENLRDQSTKAIAVLQQAAQNQEILTQRIVNLTSKIDRMLRCACPTAEPIATQFAPGPLPERAWILASDGSQIKASYHHSLPIGLVNLAGVAWEYNRDVETLPKIIIETRLVLEDELIGGTTGLRSDTDIDQYRDIREREILVDLADRYQDDGIPRLALRDGPLELWSGREPGSQSGYLENLRRTTDAYAALQARHVYYAGYVESRATRLLVSLLEIAMDPNNDDIRHTRPLGGLSDSYLLQKILKPQHRTAVYRLQARAAGLYSGPLAINFFFVNASTDNRYPHIARIEIPAWMTNDPSAINLTQVLLLEQCRIMPGLDYPYILFRADEAARVRRSDEEQIRARIQFAFLGAGLDIPRDTQKLASKLLT